VNAELDCAWQLIWDRAEALGIEDTLDAIADPRDWSTGLDGDPRHVVRENPRIAGFGPTA
jgi:hypothetical protein